jgi:hydroxyacid-oxoacid transhydrogenase
MASSKARQSILRLMNAAQHGMACPCHGCRTVQGPIGAALNQFRRLATPVDAPPVDKEYAFEVLVTHAQAMPSTDSCS